MFQEKPETGKVLMALVALSVLLLAGCAKDGDDPSPSPGASDGNVSEEITASTGGTVESTSGAIQGAKAEIPADALAQDETISLSLGTDLGLTGYSAMGPAVDFGPAGTTFSSPVTITVPYDPSALPAGKTASDLDVLHRASDSSGVTVVPAASLTVDATNHTVSLQAYSFSTYQAGMYVESDVTVQGLIDAGGGWGGPPLDDSTLTVCVFDNETKTRLSGVTVMVGTDGTNYAETDSNGIATFANLTGPQTVTVLDDDPTWAYLSSRDFEIDVTTGLNASLFAQHWFRHGSTGAYDATLAWDVTPSDPNHWIEVEVSLGGFGWMSEGQGHFADSRSAKSGEPFRVVIRESESGYYSTIYRYKILEQAPLASGETRNLPPIDMATDSTAVSMKTMQMNVQLPSETQNLVSSTGKCVWYVGDNPDYFGFLYNEDLLSPTLTGVKMTTNVSVPDLEGGSEYSMSFHGDSGNFLISNGVIQGAFSFGLLRSFPFPSHVTIDASDLPFLERNTPSSSPHTPATSTPTFSWNSSDSAVSTYSMSFSYSKGSSPTDHFYWSVHILDASGFTPSFTLPVLPATLSGQAPEGGTTSMRWSVQTDSGLTNMDGSKFTLDQASAAYETGIGTSEVD